MSETSKFWRPKKHGRNIWFWIAVVVLIFGVLRVNNVLNIGASFFQLIGFGMILLILAFVEDLRYRFYRKFEQSGDEEGISEL